MYGRRREDHATELAEHFSFSSESEDLAKAYSAVGDAFQNDNQFDKAIPLFQTAAQMAKEPYDIAYANISAAVCYFEAKKPKDVKRLRTASNFPVHRAGNFRMSPRVYLSEGPVPRARALSMRCCE